MKRRKQLLFAFLMATLSVNAQRKDQRDRFLIRSMNQKPVSMIQRYFASFFLVYIFFFPAYAQHSCKDCLYDLYNYLETNQLKTIEIGTCTYPVEQLYQGKNNSAIFAAIKDACVFSYGNLLDSVVEISLGDRALYFMVSIEPPRSFKYPDINSIYDGKGQHIVYENEKMALPAVINDPDGFTYIREKPSAKSRITSKLLANEIFLYTPIFGSDWYRVYSDNNGFYIGYIYKKRILPYDKCPNNIKKKMTRLIFD